jgi:hypothetical protein
MRVVGPEADPALEAGNVRLRTALYLPTLTAIRFNPVLKAFYGRLVAAGKPKMRAVGACMRKRVIIRHGVLRTRPRSTCRGLQELSIDINASWFGARVETGHSLHRPADIRP